jgi:hypothetical protein
MALGDALCRHTAHLPPDEATSVFEKQKKEKLLFGATTTACLAFLDALLLPRSGKSLADTFALKIETFAAVGDGEALRGRNAGIKGLWLDAARALANGEGHTLVGGKDLRADALALALPLAFALGDGDDEVAESLVEGLCLLNRHPRVVASAAFVLGAWRHLARKGDGPGERVFGAGERFAHRALDHLESAQKGVLVERKEVALAALQGEFAGVDPDGDPRELLFPRGMDGRDAPERMVAIALCARRLEGQAAMEFLEAVACQGGASDVLGALVGATLGLKRGGKKLPLGWVDRLAHRSLLDSRLALLTDRSAPVAVLLEWELAASRGVPPAAAAAPSAKDPSSQKTKEQLKLL